MCYMTSFQIICTFIELKEFFHSVFKKKKKAAFI